MIARAVERLAVADREPRRRRAGQKPQTRRNVASTAIAKIQRSGKISDDLRHRSAHAGQSIAVVVRPVAKIRAAERDQAGKIRNDGCSGQGHIQNAAVAQQCAVR